MSHSSNRALGRRRVAVLLAASAAFGGLLIAGTQTVASAHETTVDLPLKCTLIEAPLVVHYTVNHEPDKAEAGKAFTLKVASSVPAPVGFEALKPESIEISIPVPSDLAGGTIATEGGNLTKASATTSGDITTLVLKPANADVTLGNMKMPTLVISATVSDGVGSTIVVEGPTNIKVNLGGGLGDTCTAQGDNVLVKVPASGSGGPNTVKRTTTTTTAAAGGEKETEKPKAVKATPKFTG
jgi:hypothetical protein